MSIKVDENDPVGELEPSFPYKDVVIRRNVDVKEYYDLESEIGRGKFGTVYRCREKSTGLTLAAKFVGIARREDRRNVEREVDIMRMLQHPRIIQLYDAFEASNVMCVVQELIEGGELFDRVIGDDFILTEKSCTVFVRQICEGVAFIHSKNILHLDLKPENILCLTTTGNRIKIIDFGLARQYDPSKKLQVLFGTPEFVAPEVVNFDAIGFGTDMWSIGVICYVLLSGLSPFMGETDVETMANVTIAHYDFDDEAFDDISEDAKDFIRKLLLKDINGRMTASECLNHPWLRRRPPPRPASLDTTKESLRETNKNLQETKENLRETVERWGEREPSPTQVVVIPQSLPTPPPTPESILAAVAAPKPAEETKPPELKEAPEAEKKGVKNSGDFPSPDHTKQAKIEMAPVKSKEIKDTGPEETKVSTLAWASKKPSVKTQKSVPDAKVEFPSKFPLKPSTSQSGTITSQIQQGGAEITISKKSLNPSPQPKISGIVLGQTHPRATDMVKKDPPKPKTEAPAESKPKVITHKILVEGKDVTHESNESKTPSKPINIAPANPLLRALHTDRFERRCSDISCFLHDIENTSDSSSIMSEIKKLSTRLFESHLLDESNNNSNNLLRQFANRGVSVPRRPKFRVTNLNRDVPIGSPPPATNMTYFIPPNLLSPEAQGRRTSQTHSAPESPRSSPERSSDPLTKDVIQRLFDKLDEHADKCTMESVASYVRKSSISSVSSLSSK